MMTEDTIAAISTPLGHSGIGIVRLSGRDSVSIADRIFVSPGKKSLKQKTSRRIVYGHIINTKKEILDEVLVSVMTAPHTYTREDIVEINCHGGPVPLRRILELVIKGGARLAEPGEFTRRAFLNGRIDLAQAEAVLDVINSMTEQSQKAAVEQLRGRLSKKIESIREELVELIAFVEAYIDFPDEDIEPPSLKELQNMALKIRNSLRALTGSSQFGMILREGLKTAIIGRPNVGKSSLLNALLEQDRAIVTEIPGTTRDIIEDYLNIHGIPVRIMDTAGIREVKNIAEKEGVKRSLMAMKEADLVILILDGSENLHNTDRQLIRKSNTENTILVINKTDLPQKIRLSEIRTKGESNGKTVSISAIKGTGLDDLKNKIAKMAVNGRFSPGAAFVTNVRHVHALKKALSSINSFIRDIKKVPPEFLAVELRDALDSIGEIVGSTTTDDILDRIFSDFCIGK
ncbi:MAG: tRNA uridine-5-carboxymethylaminomethyl(34) synthesis GTPase MnmE [Candidatus Mariimomonas ferrooxydans]